MKARQIATQRIGEDNTPRKPKDQESTNLIWFGLLSAIVMTAASIIGLQFPKSRNVARTTVLATFAPTSTTSPTTPPTPTILPATPAPLPTVALERGVMLAQVWLYDAPGGEKLSAGLLAGQEVTILERCDNFAKVRWEGKDTALVGWVMEKWIGRNASNDKDG